MPDQRFRPGEHLKSRRVIRGLFQGAPSFVQYPLRLVWQPMETRRSPFPIQMALSVPKRRFRSAVQRNRLRRRMREAYRLHKSWLYQKLEEEERQLAFMIIYVGKEELPFEQIQGATRRMLRRFLKDYRQTGTKKS